MTALVGGMRVLNTNFNGTLNLLEISRKFKSKFLLSSTSEVYGVSEDPIWTEETKSLIGPTTKLRWSYAASKMIDEFIA